METKTKYISITIAAIAIVGISIGGYAGFYYLTQSYKTPLKVFHAGSLAVPLEYIELIFEHDHPSIDVQLEAAGSSECVKKITEQGEAADVLASADWSLINNMGAEYKNYTIQFATNQMVLCYYGDLPVEDVGINGTNFWEYLNVSREDITEAREWGFSNPNLDPCGYRTLMVLQLAEINYSAPDILDDLVMDLIPGITNTTDGTNYNITCAENLEWTGNVNIRDKSVDLVEMLKSGSLNYAFEYMSVAIQHNLNFITFESTLALNDTKYDDDGFYKQVKVIKSDGSSSTGKSITYGVTVPLNADHPDLGAEFIEYIINDLGKGIFEWLGQPTFKPCPTAGYGTWIPDNIIKYCTPL